MAISRSQYGLIGRNQLEALGLSEWVIKNRIDSGRLLPACPGTYALGREIDSKRGIWMAGVLAGGPGSLLARESAAELWGLIKAGRRVEILRPHGLRPNPRVMGPPGLLREVRLAVRRSRWIPPEHIESVDGIPVTSVAMVLLDLAGFSPDRQLRSAFNEADRRGLLNFTELWQCSLRGNGRKGVRRFRRLVVTRHPETAQTRSDLEVDFISLCREHGLGDPKINSMVAGHRVDFCWPDSRLVVELDGYETHRGRMNFERDTRRDYQLKCAGYSVIRLTYHMVHEEAESVIRLIRRELRQTEIT